MSVYVGAYPVLLRHVGHAPALYEALSASPAVRGLEHPWTGSLSVADLIALRSLTPDHWQLIVTMIPGTMGRSGVDPSYGLASADADAAAAATSDVAGVLSVVRDFHDAVGAAVVTHVEVHSAPRHTAGSTPAALARSLAGLIRSDAPALVVEHVDAPVSGRAPAKGFLSLPEEIDVVGQAGAGLVINWGRSAIETRHPDGPAEHISLAAAAGVLRGLILSGVSDVDTAYGPAWSDEHLPFAEEAPGSLLTEERAARAIALAGDAFLGVKMNWAGTPETSADMVVRAAERVAALGEAAASRPEGIVDDA